MVQEVSVEYYPLKGLVHEQINIFDPKKKEELSGVYRDFIKLTLNQNFLPAVQESIRKALNKCLPEAQRWMFLFDGLSVDHKMKAERIQSKKYLLKIYFYIKF